MPDIPESRVESPPAPGRTPQTAGAHGLGATAVLALGAFAVGTDAYVVAGFLPAMAGSLHVSQATAGQSATAFAIAYALLSPVLATAAARMPRRALLVTALLVLATANLGTALAPDFPLLMAFRIVAAFGAAAFTPNAGAAAAALVPVGQRARALAVVIGGLTVATALGVPLGNLAQQTVGWRTALGLIAALCLLCAAGVRAIMPALPGGPRVALRARIAAVRRPGVASVLPLTVAGMAAGFGLYAYAVPVMRALGAVTSAQPWLLMLYGLGAIAGSLGAGAAVDRYGPFRVLATGYLALTVTLTTIGWAIATGVNQPALTGALSAAWGASTWFQTPAQQLRLITAAPQETAVVIGLNASAIYVGIAAGTGLGGILLAHGILVPLACCAALAALCLLYLALTCRRSTAPTPYSPTESGR
jgi:predicted MFS family arabinose efflux permease